jgi:hypothetical protein
MFVLDVVNCIRGAIGICSVDVTNISWTKAYIGPELVVLLGVEVCSIAQIVRGTEFKCGVRIWRVYEASTSSIHNGRRT